MSKSPTPHPLSVNGQAALYLAANLGWRVFPVYEPTATGPGPGDQKCSCDESTCSKVGKHPRTKNGFKDATTDLKTITRWWTRWPNANIGVRTGRESGIVVLDIDPRHGGDVTLEDIESTHGKLPDTVEALTGGGGRHVIFRYPGDHIGCRTDFGPGLDFKGDGGYIVAAPSLHASGNRYSWEWSSHPDEVVIAEMPEWLIDLVTRDDQPKSSEPASAADAGDGTIEEGRRDKTLASLAGTMRRAGFQREEIEAALAEVNQRRCKPPLPDKDVRRIAKSIAGYERGEIVVSEWQIPTPLNSTTSPPPFPIDQAFPPGLEEIREFVVQLATQLQVPVDLPAMLLPPIVSCAISQKFMIEIRDGWREIGALWTMSVLDSGERKSGTLRRMTDPVLEWEKDEAHRLGPEIAEAIERRKVLERMRDEARKKGVNDEQARERAVDLARQLAEAEPILVPSLVLTDVTSEALVEMMVSNGERALIATPEGDAFDVMMGRYDDRGRPNLGVWLKSYTGDRVRVLRKSRQPEYLERPAISIAGAVQPEVVHGLVANSTARGRGLLARILWSVPEGMVGRRVIGARPVDDAVEMAYVAAIRRLLDIKVDPDLGVRVLRLSPEAAAAFTEFEVWVEKQLGRGGGLSGQRTWGAKLCGAIARIAMALHCLQEYGRGSAHCAGSALEISLETMQAALAWAPYLIAHERIARGILGCSEERVVAERILAWIERKDTAQFTRRDCFSAVRGEFVEVTKDVDHPLSLLADLGYIRPLPPADQDGQPGRRPSPAFEVNPLWDRGGDR